MPSTNPLDPTNYTALIPSGNPSWHNGSGTLTYSFLTTLPGYYTVNGSGTYNIGNGETVTAGQNLSMTAQQQAMAQLAIDRFNEVATINMVMATGGAIGDITFGMDTMSNNGSGLYGFAYYPGASNSIDGDIWLNNLNTEVANPTFYDEGWDTFIHELGHALGLEHPFSGTTLPANLENSQYSVMSYDPHPAQAGIPDPTQQFPATPMIYDIQALQFIYGANMSTRTGDDVYFASGGVSGYEIANGGQLIATIWDAGGNDTFNAAAQTSAVTIDLRPGYWSTIGSIANNIGIALGVDGTRATSAIIENAVGGSAGDTLQGNEVANSLFGNGGADTLNGDGGNDMLYGGLGADILNGGTGTDFARYDTASAAVTVHLANDQANTGEAFGDTFTDIEGLYLTLLHNDVGFGDGNNNTLYGLGGNDTLNGGGGNDMLFGGTGADTLNGGTGTDYARYDDATSAVAVYLANDRPNSGEAAGDTFTGIEGLYLSAHNDYGFGDDNPNTIYGLGGSDSLAGGLGADYLDGGEGFDYVRYDDAAYPDDIRVYLQSQYSNLNTGVAAIGDIFVSIEGLQTSVRNDTLFGNSENNILLGNLGTDNLYGFTGNDTLYGGAGDPNGDGVRDNFVFDQAPIAANADIVGDFERGLDQIALSTDIFGTNEARIQLNPNTSELVYTGVNGNEYNVIATLIGETVFDASDYYFY
ncbi:M10 family metallopeptidase C-terminal domain-containing protein [Hoeflea sp.]|uniref:M10 family metallopeptidase C-terminal domain-containing protein n=1 Tax=Hoeflea sp. TaxID=1940281 RepID=UPI003BB13815